MWSVKHGTILDRSECLALAPIPTVGEGPAACKTHPVIPLNCRLLLLTLLFVLHMFARISPNPPKNWVPSSIISCSTVASHTPHVSTSVLVTKASLRLTMLGCLLRHCMPISFFRSSISATGQNLSAHLYSFPSPHLHQTRRTSTDTITRRAQAREIGPRS